MKIFNWLFNRKVKKELKHSEKQLATLVQESLEKVEVNIKSPADRNTYIHENCEVIMETSKQMDEIQKEYEAVTSYLTDVQKIDQIPKQSKEEIDDSARNLLMLTRERNKILNSESKLNQKQYKAIEAYEDDIVNEIKKMNEKEAYQQMIKKDMSHLEGEKASLQYEKNEVITNQEFLKKMSLIISVVTMASFFIFWWLGTEYSFDSKIPFLLTAALAIFSVAYIVHESHNNKVKIAVVEAKLKKTVGLTNSVKIKYVNNQCSLDYSYEKFMVNSSSKLTYLWEEYMKQKEMEKKYKNNTELLNYYSNKLEKDLRQFSIRDTEVWLHQCVALLESKEMVEIRHRLHVRRQKLRDRIEYNQRMKEECLENMKQLLVKCPEAKQEIIEALKRFHIDL